MVGKCSITELYPSPKRTFKKFFLSLEDPAFHPSPLKVLTQAITKAGILPARKAALWLAAPRKALAKASCFITAEAKDLRIPSLPGKCLKCTCTAHNAFPGKEPFAFLKVSCMSDTVNGGEGISNYLPLAYHVNQESP
jgi:hypothetical protein